MPKKNDNFTNEKLNCELLELLKTIQRNSNNNCCNQQQQQQCCPSKQCCSPQQPCPPVHVARPQQEVCCPKIESCSPVKAVFPSIKQNNCATQNISTSYTEIPDFKISSVAGSGSESVEDENQNANESTESNESTEFTESSESSESSECDCSECQLESAALYNTLVVSDTWNNLHWNQNADNESSSTEGNVEDCVEDCVIPKTSETICTEIGIINTVPDITFVNQPFDIINKNATTVWATKIAGLNIDIPSAIVTDSQNNIIVTGSFRGDFSTESFVENRTVVSESVMSAFNSNGMIGKTLIKTSIENGYIVKYYPCGTVYWAAKISGTGITSNSITSVAVDFTDNIIVVGTFSGSVEVFDSNCTCAAKLDAVGAINSFVVMYDPCGLVCWATVITSTNNIFATCIKNDYNCLCIGGYFNGTDIAFMNVDNTIGATLPPRQDTYSNIFIVKYTSQGFVQWATKIGDLDPIPEVTGFNKCLGIDVDSNNSIVITGFFNANPLVLYNAPNGSISSGITLSKDGAEADAYIIKYSGEGQAIFATKMAGLLSDVGISVGIDSEKNIVVSGNYNSTVLTIYDTPNGSVASSLQLTNAGGEHIFIVKYNVNGKALWATKITGLLSETGNSLRIDAFNNILLTGSYSNNPVIIYNSDGTIGPTLANDGTGTCTATDTNSTGTCSGTDAFIVKYNTVGHAIWATKQTGELDERGIAITTDRLNNIIVTGYFWSTSLNIFNSNGVAEKRLDKISNADTYIIKYVEYGQNLFLPASLCDKTKFIELSGCNRTNTLVSTDIGMLRDENGICIRGIIFTQPNSRIELCWENTQWTIKRNVDILLL